MVYVVLRDGRVLQYNSGGCVPLAQNGAFSILTADEKSLVARIPVDIVERVEFFPPSRIFRTTKVNSRARYTK